LLIRDLRANRYRQANDIIENRSLALKIVQMADRVGVKPTISIIPLEQLRLTSRSIPPEVRSESGSIPIGAIVESGTA